MLVSMKKRSSVLFITRRFPPSVGGMERFAFEISKVLGKKIALKKITWGGSNAWLPLVLPWFFIKGAWLLARHQDIGVLHLQDALLAPLGWLLHVIFRRPYVVVAHGLDITYKMKFYQAVVLPFVRRADRVVVISSATRSEAEKRGVKSEKIQIIALGVNDDFLFIQPNRALLAQYLNTQLDNRKVLLTTGRLVRRKGVRWFIESVLPGLVDRDKSVLYLVAGDGPERSAIQDVIQQTGLADHARLLGRVTDEERNLLYRSSDVFVMPNIPVPGDMEGFGMVVSEAATAGLAVVASELEGIADAIRNGQNGILVAPRDAGGFIEAIEAFLENDEMRQSFGKRARDYTLRAYGWETVANQYVQLYQNLNQASHDGKKAS